MKLGIFVSTDSPIKQYYISQRDERECNLGKCLQKNTNLRKPVIYDSNEKISSQCQSIKQNLLPIHENNNPQKENLTRYIVLTCTVIYSEY